MDSKDSASIVVSEKKLDKWKNLQVKEDFRKRKDGFYLGWNWRHQ
jgi:hypothetical protein